MSLVIESLLKAATLSGFKIYNENEYHRILQYQLDNGQFEFIEYEDKAIGFFGWLIKGTPAGLDICINNMFILPQYRKNFNIFDMCKFFKDKYPNVYKFEWHNQKKGCFKQLILKGRKV